MTAPATPSLASLPRPRSRLIGRQTEIALGRDLLLAEAVPLLALTGPGGIGKTRLALAIASEVSGHFADGVAFVDLSTLQDPALILGAVSRAVGVTTETTDPEHQLLVALRPQQVLLVLDNCEHLLEAVAELTGRLLAGCPAVQVLATSRAPLHLQGEQELPVPPLAVSDDMAGTGDEPGEAIALFVQRARAVRPGFTVDEATRPVVLAICRRLDGLPLAIELAAAWIRLLPPHALFERLSQRVLDVPGAARDLPERQQTLRETIAWSHELLGEEERILFRRLAIFAGGFDLPAAQAVAGAVTEPAVDVLAGLGALVEQSLVQRSGDERTPRFTMLETIREFALEQLAANGDEGRVQERHATYFLALAERAEPELLTGTQADWVARLEADHGNFRAALGWATQHGDAEAGLRLAAALWRFWHRLGYWQEGRGWLTRLLARTAQGEQVSPATRAKALAAAGWLAQYQNDLAAATTLLEEALEYDRQVGQSNRLGELLLHQGMSARFAGEYQEALALLEEGLKVYRNLGDQAGVTQAINHLALVLRERGEYARASTLYEEGLALRREAGDRSGEAVALLGLGDIARDVGDVAQLRSRSEASLATFRELGEPWGLAFSLHNLALAAYLEKDLRRARSCCEESVAIFRRHGVRGGLTEVLVSLGGVLRASGEPAAAIPVLTEALQGAATVGPRWLVAASLEGLAGVATELGQSVRAARLASVAASLRAVIGVPVRPNWQRDLEQAMATARAALSEEAFAAAWTAGQELPLDDVVTAAIALTADAVMPTTPAQSALTNTYGLSPREVDVLRLLVAGRADREIADRLFISPRTASKHVGNILAKLDVASRAEAAIFAIRRDLV